jgi:hypothetical protein
MRYPTRESQADQPSTQLRRPLTPLLEPNLVDPLASNHLSLGVPQAGGSDHRPPQPTDRSFARCQNQGRRRAGVDGLTMRTVLEEGVEAFVEHVRAELKAGVYRPSLRRRRAALNARQEPR